jgi:uncharacterized membrane protein YeaQ/YmgE (transglycosylase-associated protein family)
MDIVTWLIVGLFAGVLASLLVGGYGLVADILVGIAVRSSGLASSDRRLARRSPNSQGRSS